MPKPRLFVVAKVSEADAVAAQVRQADIEDSGVPDADVAGRYAAEGAARLAKPTLRLPAG